MRSRKHTTILHAQQCPDLFCHLCPSQRRCLNDDTCRQALWQIHRLFLAWIHIDLTTNSKSSCLIVGPWMAGDQSDCLRVSRVPINCQENPLSEGVSIWAKEKLSKPSAEVCQIYSETNEDDEGWGSRVPEFSSWNANLIVIYLSVAFPIVRNQYVLKNNSSYPSVEEVQWNTLSNAIQMLIPNWKSWRQTCCISCIVVVEVFVDLPGLRITALTWVFCVVHLPFPDAALRRAQQTVEIHLKHIFLLNLWLFQRVYRHIDKYAVHTSTCQDPDAFHSQTRNMVILDLLDPFGMGSCDVVLIHPWIWLLQTRL